MDALLPPASAPGHAADAATALQQIRSLLNGAGVTAAMLDQPAGVAPGAVAVDAAVVRQIGALLVAAGVTAEALGLSGAATTDPVEDAVLAKHHNKASTRASLHTNPPVDQMTEYHPIAQDLHNMFFLSPNWSVPFLFAALTVLVKFIMFAIVLYWIYRPGGFREDHIKEENDAREAAAPVYLMNAYIVMAMQLLLIPVAIGIDEELMLTMNVVSDMEWAACATRPHASQLKYWLSNAARALDGLAWLFINGSMMFHAHDVLAMLLNFAALQFLQSVDNIAFEMAKGGYLSKGIEAAALDVTKTKLPSVDCTHRERFRHLLLVLVFLLMILFWVLITFLDYEY
jgi:hypothetical protein